MKKSIRYSIVILILYLCTSCKENSFKIVLLPDTQYYSESYPEIFGAQTKWIAKNSDSIAFVLHQGDITNQNTSKEWEAAAGAMSVLDNKVPYVVCAGNHDVGASDVRDTELFNTWFPYEKYSKTKGFGGACEEGKMDNVWYSFNAGGINWLIISLEFGPRNKVLEWASEVVKNHPSHKVIINTHAYLYSDNTRMSDDRGHYWLPQSYGLGKGAEYEDVNDGEQMWKKFVNLYPNIIMVVSGHVLNEGVGTLVSEGNYHNKVYQMLANYQKFVDESIKGGNGFLRILTINPKAGKISVQTYSPYVDEFKTEPSQQFDFKNVKF